MEKEWWEKEAAFERTFNAGRAVTNLWKYIPVKILPAIEDCTVNSDGYWVYLADGWRAYDLAEDCGQIHVYNIADLKEDLKTVRYVG